jgi:hypothetical protein
MTPYSKVAGTIQEWIGRNGIKDMNVAGPRASKDPEIYGAVTDLLNEVFLCGDTA